VATILIIERDRSIAALLAAVVEGVDAIPLFEADPNAPVPDVLLIEPATPGALEAATALRAGDAGLPIVCVSTEKPTAELRAALEPAVFLSKPFAVAQLHAILRVLVSRVEP
jgi:DNA-binding response OmpR family regulator